jgi:hypothetical protein
MPNGRQRIRGKATTKTRTSSKRSSGRERAATARGDKLRKRLDRLRPAEPLAVRRKTMLDQLYDLAPEWPQSAARKRRS